MVRKAKAVLLS